MEDDRQRTKTMNILFDVEDFKNRPRGIVKTTQCLYRACLEAMPSIRFTAIARKPLASTLPEGIDLVRLRPNMPRSVWRFIMYNSYLPFQTYSAVHFPANGMIPPLIRSRNIVMTLHDILQLIVPDHLTTDQERERFKKKRQNDINRARIVFTVSEHSKRDIIKHFSMNTEPVVLHNAPTLESAGREPVFDLSRAGNYFLYCGGYDKRKGIDRLVQVFLGLHRNKKTSSQLYLVGAKSYFSGEFKNNVETAVALGIVRELGYVSDPELAELMNRARGLIYPSTYEGFGLPPLEAMSLGCPVITTPHSSIPEVCGDAALYVTDEKQFVDAVIALDTRGPLRKEQIIKGTEQAGRFSWGKTAAIFLDHIQAMNAN
jgi:glycosyltransferase involved in cell wall biosynthesis